MINRGTASTGLGSPETGPAGRRAGGPQVKSCSAALAKVDNHRGAASFSVRVDRLGACVSDVRLTRRP